MRCLPFSQRAGRMERKVGKQGCIDSGCTRIMIIGQLVDLEQSYLWSRNHIRRSPKSRLKFFRIYTSLFRKADVYIAFLEVLQTDGSRESYFRWVQFFGGHLASLCIAATPRVARSLSLSASGFAEKLCKQAPIVLGEEKRGSIQFPRVGSPCGSASLQRH